MNPFLGAKWHLAFVALCLVSGAGLFRLKRDEDLEDRLLAACMPLLIYLIAVASVTWVVSASFRDNPWDNGRLLPSVAFLRGLDPYSSLEHGSIQTSVYPPGWVFAFLPAGFSGTPFGALTIGYCLAQAYTLIPSVLLFWRSSRSFRTTIVTFALFFLLLIRIVPLQTCFVPHADAPALGFALISLLLLHASLQDDSRRVRSWLPFFTTGAAWLSVWSKQVMVPLLPAMALLVLVLGGFRPLLRFLGWSALSGGIVAAVSLAAFPAQEVYFNTILLMSRCPWENKLPWNLVYVFYLLQSEVLYLLLFLAIGYVFLSSLGSRTPRDRLREDWVIMGVASMALVPTSLLGRVKVGGNVNTLSPTLFFLLLAVCLLIPAIFSRLNSATTKPGGLRHYKRFLILAALVIGSYWSLDLFHYIKGFGSSFQRTTIRQAYDYLRKKDPGVYFPSMPLTHLMAQGVLYNFSFAIHDRELLAQLPLSQEQKTKYFPEKPRMICWNQSDWGNQYVQSTYFPEYTNKVKIPELSLFRCFTPIPPESR